MPEQLVKGNLPSFTTKKTKGTIALLAPGKSTAPPEVEIVTSSVIAKNATTMSFAPISTDIEIDQPFQLTDPVTQTVSVVFAAAKVSSVAPDGSPAAAVSSLAIRPAAAAVPAGAVAPFPANLDLRTDFGYSSTTNPIELDSLDHEEGAAATAGTTSKTINIPGFADPMSAGFITAEISDRTKRNIYIKIEDPAPSADYTHGDYREITGFVASISEARGNNANPSADFTVRINSDTKVYAA